MRINLFSASRVTCLLALVCTSFLLALSSGAYAKKDSPQFETVDWLDLMPQDDYEALMQPPAYLSEIEDGSPEDMLMQSPQNISQIEASPPEDEFRRQLEADIANLEEDRYQQALVSTRVIETMNGKDVRIPGFIVPLEFKDEQVVTKFFLVPFFGACIHVPPPPPNQIIYVDFPEGLELSNLYDPFWLSGTLKTSLTENEMATSAYSMKLQSYEIYSE